MLCITPRAHAHDDESTVRFGHTLENLHRQAHALDCRNGPKRVTVVWLMMADDGMSFSVRALMKSIEAVMATAAAAMITVITTKFSESEVNEHERHERSVVVQLFTRCVCACDNVGVNKIACGRVFIMSIPFAIVIV